MSRRIEIELVGDPSSLSKAFQTASKDASSFGQNISKAAKVASVALIAGLAVAAKIGFSELAESQKVTAQTTAALESTGAAANVTAKEIENLAGAISRKSGIDDEAIQSGQNMLLTFTNVRNEVGKGNDIFNQATSIMADMSTALGQDMSASAMQLGKALNDPVKGMTALQRVGVTFTESQKEAVAAMVKTGDVAGAQKLILAELNKEFGGSAVSAGETLPGQLAKAQNAFAEMAASVVQSALPAVLAFSGVVLTASGYLTEHQGVAKALVGVIGGLAVALGLVGVATKVYAAAQAVAAAATGVWTAAQWLLNAALTANPIGIVIVAIAGLVAGIIVAWRESETFRNVTTAAFKAAANAVLSAVDFILGIFDKWLGAYEAVFRAAARIPGIGKGFEIVADAVGKARDKVDQLRGAIDALKDKTVNVNVVTRYSNIVEEHQHAAGRQRGGPVSRGGAFLVGERGPEIFVPRQSGTIIPNAGRGLAMAGGGGVTVHVHVQGALLGSSVSEVAQTIRRELLRDSFRQVSIFGGRA